MQFLGEDGVHRFIVADGIALHNAVDVVGFGEISQDGLDKFFQDLLLAGSLSS